MVDYDKTRENSLCNECPVSRDAVPRRVPCRVGYCAIKTRDDPETSDNEQHRPPTPSAAALAPAAVGSTRLPCMPCRLTIGGQTASHARSTAARTAIAMMVALATANARATQGNQLFSHFGRRYASHAAEHCVRWLCLSSTHRGGGQLSLPGRSTGAQLAAA